MPTTRDTELPVRPVKISGPGVDRWAARREPDNAERMTAAKMRERFETRRVAIFADLKRFIAQPF